MSEAIDRAIRLFENAVARAWVLDTEDNFNDKDRKATKEAHALVDLRRNELRAAIEGNEQLREQLIDSVEHEVKNAMAG